MRKGMSLQGNKKYLCCITLQCPIQYELTLYYFRNGEGDLRTNEKPWIVIFEINGNRCFQAFVFTKIHSSMATSWVNFLVVVKKTQHVVYEENTVETSTCILVSKQ